MFQHLHQDSTILQAFLGNIFVAPERKTSFVNKKMVQSAAGFMIFQAVFKRLSYAQDSEWIESKMCWMKGPLDCQFRWPGKLLEVFGGILGMNVQMCIYAYIYIYIRLNVNIYIQKWL